MKEVRYTLLSDGSSDKALMPLLTWLLAEHLADCAIQSEWADLRRLQKPPKKLPERIQKSVELYPCDLLFIHRDAEKEPRENRVIEIRTALEKIAQSVQLPPVVCVIPVRMQEAWLLFDEAAIRNAADNPCGKQQINLPPITKVENQPDPKEILYELLRQASGLGSNRQKKFKVEERVHRVAELIDDFSALRAVPAFIELENELKQVLAQLP